MQTDCSAFRWDHPKSKVTLCLVRLTAHASFLLVQLPSVLFVSSIRLARPSSSVWLTNGSFFIRLSNLDVNPAGPSGNPDQTASAIDVRNAFGNMGFDDAETVSLIGGGHAFGKCHGACKNSSCESLAPDGNPGTVTSGFEGQWTSTPTTWSNEYFQSLLDFE